MTRLAKAAIIIRHDIVDFTGSHSTHISDIMLHKLPCIRYKYVVD
jgi:hypothetical protein